jgi:hypothetical protein
VITGKSVSVLVKVKVVPGRAWRAEKRHTKGRKKIQFFSGTCVAAKVIAARHKAPDDNEILVVVQSA